MVVLREMFSRLAVVCVAVAAMVAAGCEQVPLLAPSASSIFVSAGATALAPGASTTITAVVSESGGTPVQNGTLVRFTATLGRIEPAAGEANGGVATATFTAGTVAGAAGQRCAFPTRARRGRQLAGRPSCHVQQRQRPAVIEQRADRQQWRGASIADHS